MNPRPTLDAEIRLRVFEHFRSEGEPPTVEKMMVDTGHGREEVERSLDRLDEARHLKLVPGTHRILMAFPFSAIATPYTVSLDDGRRYYANCAWDSIAFFPMLREPIRIQSYCYHCGREIQLGIEDGGAIDLGHGRPVVYLGLPAIEWWKNIVTTCSNTMLFFASGQHLRSWRSDHPAERGAEVSVEVILKLSELIYSGKMERGYVRPTHDQLARAFESLELTGDFWKI